MGIEAESSLTPAFSTHEYYPFSYRLLTPSLPDALSGLADSQGSTALHWACYGGSLELVEWLVKDAGAKVGHKNKVMCYVPVGVLPTNE